MKGQEGQHGKPIWQSKTFWTNLMAASAMLVQTQTGFVIDAEMQMILLGLVNILLRAVTGQPVTWHRDSAGPS